MNIKTIKLINYKPLRQPQECKNISEIRNEIDSIDHIILKMLGKRFQYVKEIVKYKEKTEESIVASDRREAVIAQRRNWATENGINPDVIEEMYRNLIKYFITEEMKTLNN